jgi:ribose 5-phosphate isomerase B
MKKKLKSHQLKMSKIIFKTIVIGSDHGAFEMKTKMIQHLKNYSKNITVIDVGVFEMKSVDYPDVASEACKKIQNGKKKMI